MSISVTIMVCLYFVTLLSTQDPSRYEKKGMRKEEKELKKMDVLGVKRRVRKEISGVINNVDEVR